MTARVGSLGGLGSVSTMGGARRGEPARFKPAGVVRVPMKEASDVVALPGGRLLVVGDTSDKIGLLSPDGRFTRVKLDGLTGASEFEGVAYDLVRHNLFVSREESRQILRYDWNPAKKRDPELKRVFDLKKISGPENKGIEGLAYLPAGASPSGRPQLLALKEGRPRQLLVFGDKGGTRGQKVQLEPQVKSVCKDFSAVTVDPKTFDLFISSDESSTVAQVHLEQRGDELVGRLVQSFPLRDAKNRPLARIEGLACDEQGNLFVLTENDGGLHKLARQ